MCKHLDASNLETGSCWPDLLRTACSLHPSAALLAGSVLPRKANACNGIGASCGAFEALQATGFPAAEAWAAKLGCVAGQVRQDRLTACPSLISSSPRGGLPLTPDCSSATPPSLQLPASLLHSSWHAGCNV